MSTGIDPRPPAAPVSPVPPSPPATRTRRRVWRDPRLVVGAALVTVSVVVGARLFAGADDTVTVWAARAAMRAGQPIGTTDLVPVQVRFAAQADADRYLPADSALPARTVLRHDVGAGELLPRAAVTGRPPGDLVEVPVSVPSDGVPATVRIGSTVDVWVTPDRGSVAPDVEPARARLVFDDVTVLAVPRDSGTLGPTATRQVIVGVPAAQQAALPRSLARLAQGAVVLTRQR